MAQLLVEKRSRKKRRFTEEEFMRLLDDGRKYELVFGEAKEVPGGSEHDTIVAKLIAYLFPKASKRG